MKNRVFGVVSLFWLAGVPVAALPQGGQVVNGSVKMTQPQSNVLQVLQSSPQAIVNWTSFSLSPGQSVHFFQPSSAAAILNRVTGQDPSTILGQITGNGKVFLLNPNGILFGPGSVVDVGSFVASTLSMSDSDFLAKRYNFTQPDGPMRALVNQGTLRVAPGGYLVLLSPLLDNEGVIVAQEGQVALGATRQATLNFDGQGLLQVTVPDGFRSQQPAHAPGTVILSKNQLTDVLSQVVNNRGQVEAGQVVATANGYQLIGAEGVLVNNGQILAEGANGSAAGRISLDSSQSTVLLGSGLVSAKGVNSDGGSIRAVSAGLTYNGGTVDVSSTGVGNAGSVEISGARVGLQGPVNLASEHGKAGSLLLDPLNIDIINAPNGGTQDPALFSSNPPSTNGSGTSDTVSSGVLSSLSGNITLAATQDITFDAGAQVSFANPVVLNVDAGRNLNFQSGSSVTALAPSTFNFLASTGNIQTFQGSTISAPPASTVNFSSGGLGLYGGNILVPNINFTTTGPVATSYLQLGFSGTTSADTLVLGRPGSPTSVNAITTGDFAVYVGSNIIVQGSSVNFSARSTGGQILEGAANLTLAAPVNNLNWNGGTGISSVGVVTAQGPTNATLTAGPGGLVGTDSAAAALMKMNLPSGSSVLVNSAGAIRAGDITATSVQFKNTAGNVRLFGDINADSISINTPASVIGQSSANPYALNATSSLAINASTIYGNTTTNLGNAYAALPFTTGPNASVNINVSGANTSLANGFAGSLFYLLPQSPNITTTHGATGDIDVVYQSNSNSFSTPATSGSAAQQQPQSRSNLTAVQVAAVTQQVAQVQLSSDLPPTPPAQSNGVALIDARNSSLISYTNIYATSPTAQTVIVSPAETSSSFSTSSSSQMVETATLSPEGASSHVEGQSGLTLQTDLAFSLFEDETNSEIHYWRRLLERIIIWEDSN